MSEMKQYEKSCGAVVFTMAPEGTKYLLVRSLEGFWGFPKGHMELGETELETALREIKEETGLDVRLLDGFRTTDEHTLAREGHPERIKQIVYFLAAYDHQEFCPQETEISDIALMTFDEALAAFQFESSKRILTEADVFLHAAAACTD